VCPKHGSQARQRLALGKRLAARQQRRHPPSVLNGVVPPCEFQALSSTWMSQFSFNSQAIFMLEFFS
jgi:hypothetical protein